MSRDGASGDSELGEQRWTFDAGDTVNSPAVADGTVYVGSNDHHLYAVDATTGDQQWALETGDLVLSSPAVADGTVYVGSNDHHLYAVDATTGDQQWTLETGHEVGSSPAVADGTVYIGSRDGTLYAVDAATGDRQWTLETDDEVEASPEVADGTAYIGSGDGTLYAVDAATGDQQWTLLTDHQFASPAVADGTVYVGSWDHHLYAIDAATGDQQWALETGDLVLSSPAVADGTVYVGSYDHHLYAVDATTGDRQWTLETGSMVNSSPVVVDGTVYVGSGDGNLYAVDAATGEERWVFEIERFAAVPSPAVADGTVYVGSDDGTLYAVTAEEAAVQGAATEDDSDEGGARSSVETGDGIADVGGEIPNPEAVASPPRRDLSYDDLEPVAEVGVGGQAVIHKARVTEAKRPPEFVALREPDTSATLTREAVEEFRSQAETWATIDAREREKQRWEGYEHVVGIVATGDRQPWLAMEFMDGGDLDDLLAEHPDGLPVAQALWYGECVCKGLEVAHNLGRVHLDVKPGNVLLKTTDGWPWPKLADWGLARTLADETGTMEGLSVEYAGPEQFDSGEFGDPDQLTDIYQTGALVYALLTGAAPASGSQFEVMQQVMGEEPLPRPSERRDELPPAVDAAVGLALEREKTDRYDSIGNFGAALRAIRTGERLPRAVADRLDG